jgi:hypothetical protein
MREGLGTSSKKERDGHAPPPPFDGNPPLSRVAATCPLSHESHEKEKDGAKRHYSPTKATGGEERGGEKGWARGANQPTLFLRWWRAGEKQNTGKRAACFGSRPVLIVRTGAAFCLTGSTGVMRRERKRERKKEPKTKRCDQCVRLCCFVFFLFCLPFPFLLCTCLQTTTICLLCSPPAPAP